MKNSTNKTLVSNIDKSVNFIEDQLIGFLESRYVRKTDDYFICYLSSQTGCNRGCKFCHLTATNQVQFKDSDYQDYLNQALQVFRHYRKEQKAKYMHYNFMARGEALANKNLLANADKILISLADLADQDNLIPKFNISTIIPKTFTQSLTDVFKIIQPTMYYSLYSMNPEFRQKWIPSAINPLHALDLLKDYQSLSKKIIKIHYAFIKGENDSLEDLAEMCNELDKRNLLCEFNLVRYNPYSPLQGEESTEKTILRNMEFLASKFKGKVQMIPRVGFDVKASCGMFVDKKKN